MTVRFKVRQGECLDVLRGMRAASVHALISDPPASINYQGRDWDKGPNRAEWVEAMRAVMAECLRVCTPGAYAAVWAFPRRSHWMALAMEDAGWEIRDIVHHIFPRGQPAGLRVILEAKRRAETLRELAGLDGADLEVLQRLEDMIADGTFAGLETGLKPAAEHWIIGRAPIETNVLTNVINHGTGAIRVDDGRAAGGQWPANVAPDEETWGYLPGHVFWCPKPKWDEKDAGLEGEIEPVTGAEMVKRKPGSIGLSSMRAGAGRTRALVYNDHPTVKAVQLMRHLTRLFAPPGGAVLDPFCGSGSGGVAALLEGRRWLGIDREARNVKITEARCAHALSSTGT